MGVLRRLVPASRRGRSPGVFFGSIDGARRPVHAQRIEILGQLERARSRLEAASSVGTTLSPAIRALRRAEILLQRPLRVAIIGEFNSGKSSLANLLARIESLPTAIVASTRIPTLLYHAPEPEIWAAHLDGTRQWLRADRVPDGESILRLEVGLPSPRLRAAQILDLPGLADPRFDGSLTDLAVHGVDAALWCTVSTQAWKESERAAWGQLSPRLRSRGLLVTTHGDLLHDAGDTHKLLSRLRSEAGPSFRAIVLTSTTEALEVMRGEHPDTADVIWKASGADALDTALDELLETVVMHRNEAALRVIGRIASRTLLRLEQQDQPAPASVR